MVKSPVKTTKKAWKMKKRKTISEYWNQIVLLVSFHCFLFAGSYFHAGTIDNGRYVSVRLFLCVFVRPSEGKPNKFLFSSPMTDSKHDIKCSVQPSTCDLSVGKRLPSRAH